MSDSIDNDLNLDLHFLPAWAKEPSNRNLYADFQGGREDRPPRGRGDRPFRRREGEMPGQRPQGRREGPPGRRPEGSPRPPGAGRPAQQGGGRPWDRGRRDPGREARPAPAPEPPLEVRVAFRPDDKGVDSLARQIKMTGRAYPLFGVAQMVLAKPERHSVTFSVKKGAEGQVLQPLFVCALDDTLWLSEQEAVNYALDKHFNTFYQAEKTAIEPPKGTYTFVAQCGMSGVILGPPNHHDYQNQLRRLHGERFSRMPFDAFKARVKIVRDEETIKKWIDSQSWRTEYTCLNMPEPLRLGSMEEVEKHFRENHLPIIIKQVESHTLAGAASRLLRSGPLLRLLRAAWEDQKRFPMQVATVLSQQFASRGLQFFKVNKNITHVAVARPHYLDLDSAPVSEGIRRIVMFIGAHPKCTRRQLLDALAPAAASAAPAPAPAAAAAEASSEGAPPSAVAPAEPAVSPEATMMISDLHWLIHQGHVIEFADGLLETAKKPLPKPPPKPPAAVPAGAPAQATVAETVPAETASAPVADEAAPEPSVELSAVTGSAVEQAEVADAAVPAVQEEAPPQPEPSSEPESAPSAAQEEKPVTPDSANP